MRVSSGDKEIIAVALLDGGAQSSLGTDDLFKKLGINERPSNLKLTTVTGETTEYKSMTANIIVKPLDCSHTVPMDHVRSIPKLPIAKSCSAKKEDIKNVETPQRHTDCYNGSTRQSAYWRRHTGSILHT